MTGLILPYRTYKPVIADDAFIAPGAVVIGNVEIGPGSSVWFNAVVRGDVNEIRVGARTNIQDGTVVHVTTEGHATYIGADVTVGHNTIIHACTLEDGCLVGMGATLMDGVVVESGAMVAAGALVTFDKRVRRGELWAGSPAKCLRELTQDELDHMTWSARNYAALAREYRAALSEGEA
jgi:carbonic anhydrase/acetyltransferase-like protein (isoleucine patch superfamily)